MTELTTYDQRDQWLSTRERVGFIGDNDMVDLDIWTIELYRRSDGGYSIFITTDSDESYLVCDFEDDSKNLKPACHKCNNKASCLSLINTNNMSKCIWWRYLIEHEE